MTDTNYKQLIVDMLRDLTHVFTLADVAPTAGKHADGYTNLTWRSTYWTMDCVFNPLGFLVAGTVQYHDPHAPPSTSSAYEGDV